MDITYGHLLMVALLFTYLGSVMFAYLQYSALLKFKDIADDKNGMYPVIMVILNRIVVLVLIIIFIIYSATHFNTLI